MAPSALWTIELPVSNSHYTPQLMVASAATGTRTDGPTRNVDLRPPQNRCPNKDGRSTLKLASAGERWLGSEYGAYEKSREIMLDFQHT